MGADNSKTREDGNVRTMERALERQRRMYEERCEELKQVQQETVRTLEQVQKNVNANQMPTNYVSQQTGIGTCPLYPNLNNIANNNAQMTAAYGNPCTSYMQVPSNSQLSPVLPTPTASLNQAAEAFCSTTAPTISRPRPQPQVPPRAVPQYEAAKSVVKCLTCSNELGLQIYQCKKGHSSCNVCKLKNMRCGLCTELITNMRNFALETHMANIKLNEFNDGVRMKCPNSLDGCCLSFRKNEMEEHVKECPYREMPCPLTTIFGICTWKGKINQLVMHFKEEHREHYEADVDKEMYLLNINVNNRIVYLVNISAFHFLVHIEVDRDQKIICMTVQTMSTKFSASKWSYELHVYNKRQPRRKYQFIDTCISNSESVSEIFMQKKCAVLSVDYARTFLDNNQLTYKFYIKKK